MTPKVSVIVPTYHCDRYVAKAGGSVLGHTRTITACKVKKILSDLPTHKEDNLGKRVSKFRFLFWTSL